MCRTRRRWAGLVAGSRGYGRDRASGGSGRRAALAGRSLCLCASQCDGSSGGAGGGSAAACCGIWSMPALRRSMARTGNAVPGDGSGRHPCSLYAATKRADELMSHAYAPSVSAAADRAAVLYRLWALGPAGHGVFQFCRAIVAGSRSRFMTAGELRRDFTYIDDIVAGVLGSLDRPPLAASAAPAEYRQSSEWKKCVSMVIFEFVGGGTRT